MLTGLRQTVALGVAVLVIGAHWLPGRATPPPSVPTRVEPAPVFRWPLDGPPRPVRRFDPPPLPWLPGHRGVDLAAAPGATVRAAGAGTVLFADMVAGRPVVTVGHPGGLRTTYEPVHPEVHPGDVVAAGAPLGVLLAGHPGCPTARAAAPTGSCLHWGRGGARNTSTRWPCWGSARSACCRWPHASTWASPRTTVRAGPATSTVGGPGTATPPPGVD